MSVYSENSPLPEGMSIVQIGLVDGDLAKNFPVEIALKADVKETLGVLIPALEWGGGAALRSRARNGLDRLKANNWSSKRRELVARITARGAGNPIDPDWLALQVIEAMPENGILVDEGLTSSRYIPSLRAHRDRYGYHALASGGIGWDCLRPSVPASQIRGGPSCAMWVTAAPCIQFNRFGPQRITRFR
jgi:benzoylformate decarboxylase